MLSRVYFGNCENSPAIQPICRIIRRIILPALRIRPFRKRQPQIEHRGAAQRQPETRTRQPQNSLPRIAPPAAARSPSDLSPAHAAAYSSHSRIASHYAREENGYQGMRWPDF